jgi:D-sedoheptulose 7-phosphate isomerase
LICAGAGVTNGREGQAGMAISDGTIEVAKAGGRMSHAEAFFAAAARICRAISFDSIEMLASEIDRLRARGGRLFLLGVGGSAANCSHAVNDFRKLCGIEAYTPLDNVAELTARTNDEGWDSVFAAWLDTSRLSDKDAVLVYSVGGGDAACNISTNIVKAVDLAKARSAKVLGIVGRDCGHTAVHGDVVVIVPQVDAAWVTPLSEAFQAMVWHCLVSHPRLQRRPTKW